MGVNKPKRSFNQGVVFLDKDGTLVVDVPYNVEPDRVRLMSGAPEGLQALSKEGYRFVIVSNQSGVARGFFSLGELAGVEARIRQLLSAKGILLEGFYFCPHHPQGVVAEFAVECGCRKPRPGMLIRAMKELGLNSNDVWMIGDILDDVEAGTRAGCRTVLINNGGETVWRDSPVRRPGVIATDLVDAARQILSKKNAQTSAHIANALRDETQRPG